MPFPLRLLSFLRERKKRRRDVRRAHRIARLIEELERSDDPRAWIDRESPAENKSAQDAMVEALQNLFDSRSATMGRVFSASAGAPISTLSDAWIALKRAEVARTSLSQAEIQLVRNLARSPSAAKRAARRVDRLLLNAAIAHMTGAELAEFLRLDGADRLTALPLATRLRLVERLGGDVHATDLLEPLQLSIEEDPVEFNRLKLENARLLSGTAGRGWTHEVAEAEFARTANPHLAQEFTARIKPAYNHLRPRMTYMDVRSSDAQKARIADLLSARLRDRTPFSVLRLSDGEGYLFPDDSPTFESDARNRERHWWGCEIEDALRVEIRAAVLDAVRGADILGIPSVYRLFRDFGATSKTLDQTVQTRGLVRVLEGVAAMNLQTAAFTEDKVSVALFADPAEAARLAQEAQAVVIVTSVREGKLPSEIRGIPDLTVLNIPTHVYTLTNEAYFTGTTRLPFCYRDTLEGIRASVKPGTLTIVAAGLVGKIFVGEAKALGGVALDIGHVIDDWCSNARPTLR